VIQERKKSLEDKNRELAKLSQERQKETSQLERGLVNARDELLTAKRQVDDLEKEKEGLEEKIKELTGVVEDKTVDILMLSKEKKSMEEENSAKIAKMILEKDQLVDDHKKVVLNLISDGQKEKEKTFRDIAMLKKDVEERDEKCNQLRIRLVEGERVIERKTEELEQVRVGQEEIRKRNEFRSNLEKSFESLQKQFQAKVDELERVKKELGHDDNKRRRTSNEIRHTSER